MSRGSYRAIVSSDWNQCLAPCGPFDPIIYNYPDLAPDLTAVFKEYTGNRISLGAASERIKQRLPQPLSIEQMDAYLDDAFVTYKGVPELIEWCEKNSILFMINTTGAAGYFQRISAKQLLPRVPVISANPLIRYPHIETDPPQLYDLYEIQEKGKNTARALKSLAIPGKKIVIMGDSGGDGPHFEWGRDHDAYLVGSMAKPSLTTYCIKHKIGIDLLFGPAYAEDEEEVAENEMLIDFMELSLVFEKILK
jgi:hypothetical protein